MIPHTRKNEQYYQAGLPAAILRLPDVSALRGESAQLLPGIAQDRAPSLFPEKPESRPDFPPDLPGRAGALFLPVSRPAPVPYADPGRPPASRAAHSAGFTSPNTAVTDFLTEQTEGLEPKLGFWSKLVG